MSIGDIFYMIAMVVFSFMTFLIIRGNFQRKFNDKGERLDLIEKDKKEKQCKEKED